MIFPHDSKKDKGGQRVKFLQFGHNIKNYIRVDVVETKHALLREMVGIHHRPHDMFSKVYFINLYFLFMCLSLNKIGRISVLQRGIFNLYFV